MGHVFPIFMIVVPPAAGVFGLVGHHLCRLRRPLILPGQPGGEGSRSVDPAPAGPAGRDAGGGASQLIWPRQMRFALGFCLKGIGGRTVHRTARPRIPLISSDIPEESPIGDSR
jgi:hypothetical protein